MFGGGNFWPKWMRGYVLIICFGFAKARSAELNEHLRKKARAGADIGLLLSPVTGGGIAVNRIDQLFLQLIKEGSDVSTEALTQGVWQILQ